MRGWRSCRRRTQNDLGRIDVSAVEGLISLIIGTKRSAIERYTRKQPTSARVSEDLGSHIGIRVRFRRPADWPSGRRYIAAKFDLAMQQTIGTMFIHDQQYKIGSLAA